ncbi:AB22G [Hepatospora eriocheir]|uniref:AB22G n=1 Tax=Hepatospora eriocheir TaxID=1081669 RepID=A0A1X0QFV5_9MICR|nr:AB22G [Hepatospora eriocheir]
MNQDTNKKEISLSELRSYFANTNENVDNSNSDHNTKQFSDMDLIKDTNEELNNNITSQTKTQPIQLTFSDVNIKTNKGKFLVKGVFGTVKPGKFVALLGPSGCGKTTLMNAITGSLDKTLTGDGQVYLNKELINSNHQENLIAFCEHKILGYENLTVMTQVDYAASRYNKNSKEIANNIIDALYLTEEKDKEYQVCSGGQQVRISIAANLTTKASIYLLDEPLTGLDSYSARKVIVIIKELTNLGKAVLLSVHQPSDSIFDMFDEFILMTNGSIVFQGTKEEAIKYFATIGFVKEQELMSYPDFFLKIITMEKKFKGKNTEISQKKYNLLVDSWKSNTKKIEIEYTEPVNVKFKKYSVIKKLATMLMSNIFSFSFLFYISLIPILNMLMAIFDLLIEDDFNLVYEKIGKLYSKKQNINEFVFIEEIVYSEVILHVSGFENNELRVLYENEPFRWLCNDNPILILGIFLYYRFLFFGLFEFYQFSKFIENYKAEYKKGYFGVTGFLLASYLVSIREFIVLIFCDIFIFIYFTKNWKMLTVLIIFYL